MLELDNTEIVVSIFPRGVLLYFTSSNSGLDFSVYITKLDVAPPNPWYYTILRMMVSDRMSGQNSIWIQHIVLTWSQTGWTYANTSEKYGTLGSPSASFLVYHEFRATLTHPTHLYISWMSRGFRFTYTAVIEPSPSLCINLQTVQTYCDFLWQIFDIL